MLNVKFTNYNNTNAVIPVKQKYSLGVLSKITILKKFRNLDFNFYSNIKISKEIKIILLTIILISIVRGTYARYITTETGNNATTTSATWSFDAGIGTSIDTTTVALVPTVTYTNLAPNTIAPGTSGTFNVYLDGSGSGTGIEYTISFEETVGRVTLPDGLTFRPLTLYDGTLNENNEITGIIAYSTIPDSMKKTISVVWEWTLGTNVEYANYDAVLDTGANNADAGKNYSVDVKILGEQIIK